MAIRRIRQCPPASGALAGPYVAVLLSVFLAGCDSNAKHRATLVSAGKPHEALALDGVRRLRDAFNTDACHSIWEDADPVFRLGEPQQVWVSECGRMRRELGVWQSFQTHVEHGPGVPLRVAVHGEAKFARGDACRHTHLETVWHFDRGRAELFSLYLNGEAIPSSWSFRSRKRYVDPPRKRDRKPA